MQTLSGPPNSAIPSSTPSRIYITDDQGNVVADVTSDRVKQVVPGQSLVKGKEYDVPQSYVDLIDKVNPK